MQIEEIVNRLKKTYEMNLPEEDPFKVLIFTILSARTRDENTEKAIDNLFSVYDTPERIANASEKDLEDLIRPSGFYRVKARRIKEVSNAILERYEGKVPDTLDELLSLPGVGRKTANCVLVYGFKKEAIPVDTHVHRISNRLGIVKTKYPEMTEEELMKRVPRKFWVYINDLFVKHGQEICKPIKPRCDECMLTDICDYYNYSNR
ncbi:MAG: endonuclease III [Candidatus Hydrothermarchaeota archaeon]